MLAARFLGANRIVPEDVPVPTLETGEALLQVEACGICGSDVGIFSGLHPRARAPLTIGHEFHGRISGLRSPSSHLREGDRVAVFPLISCGTCYVCRHGNPHVCRNLRLFGIDRDGGMAQLAKLPVSNLEAIPEQLAPDAAALIEPLAVAVHGVRRASLSDVQSAVVLGAGPIGLLTALVARASGVKRLIVSEPQAFRRALAADLGLETVEAGAATDSTILDVTSGEGADLVFECAGVPASAAAMTALVRCRGTIVNLGVFKKPVPIDVQLLNFREVTLIGSRVYTRDDFREAIRLASELPLERIVTDVLPLDQVDTAFDRFIHGERSCKVIVQPPPA
jgi:(R,R)-butanediol dehydrogenase / meso-butanediol dehydrogenase / diacetyl reductase